MEFSHGNQREIPGARCRLVFGLNGLRGKPYTRRSGGWRRPSGLALAIGLCKAGLQVTLLEKEATGAARCMLSASMLLLGALSCCSAGAAQAAADWSSAYTYRVDSRGLACLDYLGLLQQLEELESRGFSVATWAANGTVQPPKTSNASMGIGYWIQRPAFMPLLESSLPTGTVVRGTLRSFEQLTDKQTLAVSVELADGSLMAISTKFLFGCDGSRSTVRQCLQGTDHTSAAAFCSRRSVRYAGQ